MGESDQSRFSLLNFPRPVAVLLALFLSCVSHGFGQEAAGPATAVRPDLESGGGTGEENDGNADTPVGTLRKFLILCRSSRYDQAAGLLEVVGGDRADGALLARRLKAVLDAYVWFDLDFVSASPEGFLDDGLPPDSEEIARIPGPAGTTDPVRLVRRSRGDHMTWLFSTATVGRIERWYAHLPNRWAQELLPAPLLRPGPGELLWWQWLGLLLALVLAGLVGKGLGWMTRLILSRAVRKTSTSWDDALLARVRRPIAAAWAISAAYFLLALLGLYEPAERIVNAVLRTAVLLVFFWALLGAVDVARRMAVKLSWAKQRPASISLLSIGGRVAKVLVIVMGGIALLSQMGYPVTSLIAGLGIGGLAVALAAQKTVENLFGAFSLGVDQPFREGDFVGVQDLVGTVETVGLRSTRVRTLDRTVITIPNGQLADMRIESFAARDRIRLACTIGLVYSTTSEQMQQVLAGLQGVLCGHPKIWPDTIVVRFKALSDSSLDIEIMAWFLTRDWGEFQLIRQQVLLDFMRVVENTGTSFAFPTRTLHIISHAAPAPFG
ncbi:MAG: mechanosensitive ion channel family protein [Acidobacteria bacterium]|nr:mechanosensitive ion channel family protein [Acidobacteriota bacterium]